MEFEPGLNYLDKPALVDENGRAYEIIGDGADGLVLFGDVAGLLGMQTQYASRYIDPIFTDHPDRSCRRPNLAIGLRVKTDAPGGNYHEFGIHHEDIEEFLSRYRAYKLYASGWTEGSETEDPRELTEEEKGKLEEYLKSVGALAIS